MKIILREPSVENEAYNVWDILKDLRFLKKNGYNVMLPKGVQKENETDNQELKKWIYDKAINNCLTDKDYKEVVKLVENEYSNDLYEIGKKSINQAIEIVEKREEIFIKYVEKWKFKLFTKYEIIPTIYGVGGSYCPKTGVIIFNSSCYVDKGLIPVENCEHVITHEIIHIGIEEEIIQRLGLANNHWVKERIVDLFYAYHFLMDKENEGRVMQENGDRRIDRYLMNNEDWDNLPTRVIKFINEVKP